MPSERYEFTWYRYESAFAYQVRQCNLALIMSANEPFMTTLETFRYSQGLLEHGSEGGELYLSLMSRIVVMVAVELTRALNAPGQQSAPGNTRAALLNENTLP